jgi:hypothetical protein
MAINVARERLGRIFGQRCFYLFVVLVTLIGALPFIEPATTNGRIAVNVVNLFVIIATVAAVGRTALSFVIALLLAAPALGFQWITCRPASPLARSWAFGCALRGRDRLSAPLRVPARCMTTDKLFGAAAAYLMIGICWVYIFALVGYFHPDAFALYGTAAPLSFADDLYFSFTVLTSTGFGDITPLIRQARALCVVEQIMGALFLAVLIARLAGVYPPTLRDGS